MAPNFGARTSARRSFQDANLRQAQLQNVDLSKAQLQGADLRGARLQNVDLSKAQLQGADLRWAQLELANLALAELQAANLQEAQLQGAELIFAQLQGANLREAQLQRADLKLAELQGADLSRAQLQGANLENSQLKLALLFTVYLWHVQNGICSDARVIAPHLEPVLGLQGISPSRALPIPATPEAIERFIESVVADIGGDGKNKAREWLREGLVSTVQQYDLAEIEKKWRDCAANSEKTVESDYLQQHADLPHSATLAAGSE